MTGHQDHPGTGISAQGEETKIVELEQLVRGSGVSDIKIIDAFNIKNLKFAVKSSFDNPELSVIIVRGACPMHVPRYSTPRTIDNEKCNQCGICLLIGCPAIQSYDGQICIDTSLCMGDSCTICQQICPRKAIRLKSKIEAKKSGEKD
jgi:indolepyruvate ferredoxin oxidoreductase alpha subunit